MARQIVERSPLSGPSPANQMKMQTSGGGSGDSSDEREEEKKPKKKLSKFAQAKLEAAQQRQREA